jgi:hypothetical protein
MSQILGALIRLSIAPPHRLEQVRATFGDIFHYVLCDHTLDPRWPSEFLTRVALTIPLSWDKSRVVAQITCHKLVAEVLANVFDEIQRPGLQEKITDFNGCFSFRRQRKGTKLSTHSWGIAIDLNPESNWGGDWDGRSRDPVHFQFCSGY